MRSKEELQQKKAEIKKKLAELQPPLFYTQVLIKEKLMHELSIINWTLKDWN